MYWSEADTSQPHSYTHGYYTVVGFLGFGLLTCGESERPTHPPTSQHLRPESIQPYEQPRHPHNLPEL